MINGSFLLFHNKLEQFVPVITSGTVGIRQINEQVGRECTWINVAQKSIHSMMTVFAKCHSS